MGDTVHLEFFVDDPFDDHFDIQKDPEPFCYATVLITERGFEFLKGMSQDEKITNVATWRAFMTTLNFNFINDGTNGLTSLSYN